MPCLKLNFLPKCPRVTLSLPPSLLGGALTAWMAVLCVLSSPSAGGLSELPYASCEGQSVPAWVLAKCVEEAPIFVAALS